MSKNETVMTADQYVVAELLALKQELEETKKQLVNVTSANTYLTIENVKLETNLREIRKFFKINEGSTSNYIKVVDNNGSYVGIFAFEHDNDFQDYLRLLDLEQEYKTIVASNKVATPNTETTENVESVKEGE